MAKAKSERKLSVARALPERVELVELSAMDSDGQPLVVRCEPMDAKRASFVLNMLPGEVPKMGPRDATDVDATRIEQAIDLSMRCIEIGTALSDGEGGFVRPAFYFYDETPRDSRALDGRRLPLNDIYVMGEAVMRLSGYAGGAAGDRFPGQQ